MVDFNQSLDPVEARRRIARLAQFDLHWVEEPVEAEDAHGHARVRANSPVPIQTGENWWFPRDMEKSIAAGASDYAMLDVMKIGGVTGWLRAAALAEAASLPVSSHIFTEVSAHLSRRDADRPLARAPRRRVGDSGSAAPRRERNDDAGRPGQRP